jgi:hypothetical protein
MGTFQVLLLFSRGTSHQTIGFPLLDCCLAGASRPGEMRLTSLSADSGARLQSHIAAWRLDSWKASGLPASGCMPARDQRAYTLDLLEQRHVRIARLGDQIRSKLVSQRGVMERLPRPCRARNLLAKFYGWNCRARKAARNSRKTL